MLRSTATMAGCGLASLAPWTEGGKEGRVLGGPSEGGALP